MVAETVEVVVPKLVTETAVGVEIVVVAVVVAVVATEAVVEVIRVVVARKAVDPITSRET